MTYLPLAEYHLKYKDLNKGRPFETIDVITERMYILGDIDKKYKFVEEFENVIDWDKLVCNNGLWSHDEKYSGRQLIKKFLEKYDSRLTPKHWKHISRLSDFYDDDKLLEKYKDEVNWQMVSKNKRFSIGFILKMKDYIDFDVYFKKSYVDPIVLSKMFLYTKDHLEEVLTYKPTKNVSESENKDELDGDGNPIAKEE